MTYLRIDPNRVEGHALPLARISLAPLSLIDEHFGSRRSTIIDDPNRAYFRTSRHARSLFHAGKVRLMVYPDFLE